MSQENNVTTQELQKRNAKEKKKRYLEEGRLAVEEKKETEAQSCLDRIWYSLNCSARFDRVIMARSLSLSLSLSEILLFSLSLSLSLSRAERGNSTIGIEQSQRRFERWNWGTERGGINVQVVLAG